MSEDATLYNLTDHKYIFRTGRGKSLVRIELGKFDLGNLDSCSVKLNSQHFDSLRKENSYVARLLEIGYLTTKPPKAGVDVKTKDAPGHLKSNLARVKMSKGTSMLLEDSDSKIVPVDDEGKDDENKLSYTKPSYTKKGGK